MALIRVRVDPPPVNRPVHGLLDVAEVVDDRSAHWRAGIEYDTYHCHDAKIWGEWCTGSGLPTATPVVRTIAVTITGSGTEGGPYTVGFTPTVDGGAARTVRVSLDTGTETYEAYRLTGAGDQVIVDDLTEPFTGVATITDVLTGVAINVNVTQDATGTITEPDVPIVIAVPEPGIPTGCFGVTTAFTAVASTADPVLAEVSVMATTTAPEARDLSIYIGAHRVVIQTQAGVQPVISGLAPGTYRIGVRDNRSWSYVSGYLHIADDGTGSATLVQATCPVKEITSRPWQTLDADPFTVFAEVTCKSLGFPDAAAAAQSALEVSQAKAVERHYWESLIARAQAPAGTEAVSVVRGLAELESYIATVYNGMGVIHVSPFGAAYLSRYHLLDLQLDGRLRTWRGTPVVIGHGYLREGTDDAVTGDDFWMFVTGAVTVRHSNAEIFEALDKATNDYWAIAERTFAIIDDCPVPAGVLVTGEVEAVTP